jgi:hypothetical protein
MFLNSPQMKMLRMNRTENVVLHRMNEKWTPGSASLMGRFKHYSPRCNSCMLFFF